MKLSKRDLNLLLFLLGIIAFLVCFLAIRNPMIEENDKLRSEISSLKPVLDELQAKIAKRPVYEEGMRESREIITEISESFPTMVRPEDFIMYVVAIENHVELDSAGMSFDLPSVIAEFNEIIAPDGSIEYEARKAYKTVVNVDTIFTYNHLKGLVDYIYTRSVRTTLDSISITYNAETGVLFGTAAIGKYFMAKESDQYVETYVPPMPIGVPNPFNSLDELPELDNPAPPVENDGEDDGDNGGNGDNSDG